MNKVKALFAALLMVGVAAPVVATPSYEDSEQIQEHIELLTTIENLGATVAINHPKLCGDKANNVAGFWHGSMNLFALCQENIRRSKVPVWNGSTVMLTDDDLDTIRHEAQHVIQDCQDGTIDGRLQPYFSSPAKLSEFLEHYPDWKEESIVEEYSEDGADSEIITLELEAWAVADLVSVETIHDVLKRECSA